MPVISDLKNFRSGRIITGILILALALILLWIASSVLLITFAGILFAIFLNGISAFLSEKSHLGYGWSLLLVCIVLPGILVLAFAIAGPRINSQVDQLSQELPRAVASIQEQLRQYRWGEQVLAQAKPEQLISTRVLGGITGMFTTALGAGVGVLIVAFLGIYLAVNPSLYTGSLIVLLPHAKRPRAEQVLAALGRALRWWLIGRILSMTVIGVLTGVGLALLGIPLALIIGMIAGLLSFIPNIGPILSALPPVLLASMDGWTKAGYVIALFLAVQALESYLITPIIQQRAVSLPPAFLLFIQILFTVIFGFLGILLSTPIAVSVVVLIQMLFLQDVLGEDVRQLGD